jgi:hypothetical protein
VECCEEGEEREDSCYFVKEEECCYMGYWRVAQRRGVALEEFGNFLRVSIIGPGLWYVQIYMRGGKSYDESLYVQSLIEASLCLLHICAQKYYEEGGTYAVSVERDLFGGALLHGVVLGMEEIYSE